VKVLEDYMPFDAVEIASKWWNELGFDLKISKGRQSKLGDFRPAHRGKNSRISVNGDLGPNHFLITYTHEVAHAMVWEKYGRKVDPHGIEWRNTYSELLNQLLQLQVFPDDLVDEIEKHASQPKASSCSDPRLYKLLSKFEKGDHILFLEDLQEGEVFSIGKKRRFVKGKRRRTRYECRSLDNQRLYFVSGHAEVQLVKESL